MHVLAAPGQSAEYSFDVFAAAKKKKKNRARAWFGDRPAGFDKDLRQALAAKHVPRKLIQAAVSMLKQDGGDGGSPAGGLAAEGPLGPSMYEHAKARCRIAAMYEHVESIMLAVHGRDGALDDMVELKTFRDEETEGSGEAMAPSPRANSLQRAFGSLQRNIRETCLAPYLKY